MVKAINLAQIVKFNKSFTTIINKNELRHSISTNDTFFQKFGGYHYSVIQYNLCFTPFKVVVNSNKNILFFSLVYSSGPTISNVTL